MKTIKADELKKTLTSKPEISVINVLDHKEFEAKHIPGTTNIPLSDPNFVKNVQNRVGDKTKPVVVYCANTKCDASEKAAKKLTDAGFTDVRDFVAGLAGWEEAKYQVEGKATAGAR